MRILRKALWLSAAMTALAGNSQTSSANASVEEQVRGRPVFTTSVEWIGQERPTEVESLALLGALDSFFSEGPEAGVQRLEGFLVSYPDSSWAASVNEHLAGYYRRKGRYSRALERWQTAWEQSTSGKDVRSQKVAATVVAGWTGFLASLGRKEQMEDLLGQARALGLDQGSEAPRLQVASEALGVMKYRPGAAYRCGSFALGRVARSSGARAEIWRRIHECLSPDEGFTMAALLELAQTNGYVAAAVSRPEGSQEVVIPSVVHWKVGHYAAVLGKRGNLYLVTDPTFGGETLIEEEVFNAEASGNFLVPAQRMPTEWRQLTSQEASSIRGKGFPNTINDGDDDNGEDDPDDPCDPPPSANDGQSAGVDDPCPPEEAAPENSAMAGWRVSEPFITLWVEDVPLFYRGSDGKWVSLKLSYNHRGNGKGGLVGGFGDRWDCNWLGMLEQPSTNSTYMTNALAGGGQAAFAVSGALEYKSGRSLKLASSGATVSIQGGAKSINNYGAPFIFGDGTRRFYLTNRTDRYQRSVGLAYQRYTNASSSVIMRLTQMTDKDGRNCTLAYTNTAFPNLITSVTDPYARSARFFYDHLGRLTNITDMAGLVSSFQYDGSGAITNLITPYGNTSFRYFWGTNSTCDFNRAIEVTEPTGAKQLFAYRDSSPEGIGYYNNPDNQHGSWMYYRNSYHWNRQQYAALSAQARTNVLDMPGEDYAKGAIKHWYHGPYDAPVMSVSGTLAASAGPVVETSGGYRVGSVAFIYAGQDEGSPFVGTNRWVRKITWDFGQNSREIVRNGWGRPTEFIYYRNWSPVSFTNEFDADGRRLLRVWGPRGERIRAYGYSSTLTNLLTSVTNAAGDVTSYTYDSAIRVTSIRFPGGLTRTNVYYGAGNMAGFLQLQADLGVRTNGFAYTNGNLLAHTNELGLVRTFVHDNLNRRVSVSYPGGLSVSNLYSKLDLVGVKDEAGNWTRYGYNLLRQRTSATNASGLVTLINYCDCGTPDQIVSLSGSVGLTNRLVYDFAGRVTSRTYPDGYVVSFNYSQPYSERGSPESVQDPSGRMVHYEYGDYWQLKGVGLSRLPNTSATAWLLNREFDEYGRVIQSTDRNGLVVTNAYDSLDRLVTQVDLDVYSQPAATNRFYYSALGLTNAVDPLGFSTRYVLDSAGRVLYQTNANNEVLRFTYNPADQIKTLTDGKNQVTTWNYDAFGQVTNKIEHTGTVVFRYGYDALGQLTNRWTPQKGDTFYLYDLAGNLTNIDYPGSALDVTLQYDGFDRLTNVVDAVGTTRFGYTPGGLLASEDGPWANDTLSYVYQDRRRVSMSLVQPNSGAWVQSYTYDDYDRLVQTVSPAGPFGYQFYWGATASDQLYIVQLPGYETTGRGIYNNFDERARVSETSLYALNGTVNRHQYQFNAANQRTRQTFFQGHFSDYTYDKIGQLKTAKGWESDSATPRLQEQFGYAYDAAWNLAYRTNNALVQTFQANTLNQITNVTRSGTFTVAGTASEPRGGEYGYPPGVTNVTVSGTGLSSGAAELYADGSWARTGAALANGNNSYTATAQDTYGRTAQDSVTVYLPATNVLAYDLNGNLTNDGLRTLEYDFENQLTNIFVAGAWRSEFKYDAFGRRKVRKEFGWSGSAWVQTNEVRYVYDGLLVLQERDASNLPLVTSTRGVDLSRTLQGAGGIGGLLARTDNGAYNGGLSSVHAYYHADGNGNVTSLIDTHGAVVASYSYDPYGNMLSMSGPMAEANTYRFSSKETHPNSGLVYYLYRYYAPGLQRWISRDPIGENGGYHLYAAFNNSPLWLLDAFGESIQPPTGPPPVPVPGDPKNKWVPGSSSGNRPAWKPKTPVKGCGSQPIASWDPLGHWDVEDGRGNRVRYDFRGNKITAPNAHLNPHRRPRTGPGSLPKGAAVGAAVAATSALNSVAESPHFSEAIRAAKSGASKSEINEHMFDASCDAAVDTGSMAPFYNFGLWNFLFGN